MKKGQKMSMAQKEKISKALKGHPSFMGGYKHSQEIKDRIGKANRERPFNPKCGFQKGHKQIPNSGSFKKGQTSGSKNHKWKGGKYTNWAGYIFVLKPEHPFCNSMGYVREHRLVMERHIGRYLLPKEVVHHIDKNVSNNHISNLMLFLNSVAHLKFHHLHKV